MAVARAPARLFATAIVHWFAAASVLVRLFARQMPYFAAANRYLQDNRNTGTKNTPHSTQSKGEDGQLFNMQQVVS